jgi:hypothetical protein
MRFVIYTTRSIGIFFMIYNLFVLCVKNKLYIMKKCEICLKYIHPILKICVGCICMRCNKSLTSKHTGGFFCDDCVYKQITNLCPNCSMSNNYHDYINKVCPNYKITLAKKATNIKYYTFESCWYDSNSLPIW